MLEDIWNRIYSVQAEGYYIYIESTSQCIPYCWWRIVKEQKINSILNQKLRQSQNVSVNF